MDVSGANAADATAVKGAARQLLAKVGAAGLSLEGVADEGGLTVAQVRELFPHRDELLTALLIDAYNESGAAMEHADQAAVAAGASGVPGCWR